ncbi:CRISPR-associated helicase Cas3' [Bernardetia sp. OM2101]|uniref:CRISPR-associated helicase Cas3' n=1 Tax=Bernardetia sp. OM2101 TaxID=3344876 RepID=UPI0035CF52C1
MSNYLNKVNDYFLLISKVQNLDSIVDEMIDTVAQSTIFSDKKLVGNFIKTLFVRSIIFHDYGKVNPNFQVSKMKNTIHFKQNRKLKIGSNHSSLSAYIFIHWHLDESFEAVSKNDLPFVWTTIFLFASSIFKHHSKHLNFDKIPFNEDEYLNLKDFIKQFKISSKIPLENLFKETLLNDIFNRIEKNSHSYNLFNLFALTKLSFSLLTASDYYATFDYTNGNSDEKLTLKANDFGTIDKIIREKIIQNFKTTEKYNKALFEKTEELKNVSFESLREQNNSNLNKLRQKLAAEALTTIRNNPAANLFYLEAPTGGGKTNISLALATELLEKNEQLNKIFYVFPFTTLITQTFDVIKKTLDIENKDIIQLHSKSGFHQPNEEDNDGNYGKNRMNFISNHFINYPITLLTHINFFDILTGNGKESNYVFHRLANSIVIIDELQTYNPKHWDKVVFFLSNYARLFNMKIILMSATLPKIDELLDENSEMRGKVTHLISSENKTQFFQNPNFSGRVEFDFSMLDNWKKPKRGDEETKETYLQNLVEKIIQESEKYAEANSDSVRTLVEFITKKTATKFLKSLQENENFEDYTLYLISGEILDPRRREIIKAIKENKDKKVILITTQVVEAGVDIDMDLGFKDRSLIDSDEQLAGRVNRNASKKNCKVFMFDFDSESFIYKEDKRLDVEAMNKNNIEDYKAILQSKNFDTDFYDKVKSEIIKNNTNDSIQNLSDYLDHFKRFNFHSINHDFRLIEQENESIFVPLPIPKEYFSEEDLKVISYFEINEEIRNEQNYINGEEVWNKYVEILSKTNQDKKQRQNYIENQVLFKQIYGILSKFMFSAFSNQIEKLKSHFDNGEDFKDYKGFGIYYFSNWEEVYSYENGLDMQKVNDGEGFFL